MFGLGILISIIIISYVLYKLFNLPQFASPIFYLVLIFSCFVFILFLLFGLKKFSESLKISLSKFFFIIFIIAYGSEIYLENIYKKKLPMQNRNISDQLNISYDKRGKLEVLKDFKDSGINAFPNISSSGFIGFNYINGFNSKKGKIYPFGSISNSVTVYSNVIGNYVFGETDEYGFNNPKGKYKENKVDIMVAGNQNVGHGEVNINETLSSALDEINFNTISIASADSGPLIQLASIKEYAEPIKPKILLWAYSFNDMNNLSEEFKSPLLRKYLNDNNFSQKLISRQKEINEVLLKYIQNEWKNEREMNEKNLKKEAKKFTNYSLIRIVKLYNLRKSFNLTPETKKIEKKWQLIENNDRQQREDLRKDKYIKTKANFKKILKKSKETVSNWDGKMYFLYLPSFERYSKTNKKDPNFHLEISSAKELNIPVIDIHKEVFAFHLILYLFFY